MIDPGLQSYLETESDDQDSSDGLPRLTSWRSYNQRVQQLEKIEREDIPANAKALADARSYGDLKENHAFKEAKQQVIDDGGVFWTKPVLAGGLIYCRSSKGTLVCRDHRALR